MNFIGLALSMNIPFNLENDEEDKTSCCVDGVLRSDLH